MSEPAARVAVAESTAPVALGDAFALLKPRVMSLVVFTGAVGLIIAPGTIHPVIAAVAVLCIAIGAGGSAAINMWYDRDIDAVMTRTRARPVPAGRVEPGAALGLGIVLSVGATALMGLAVNWVAAGLLAFTIFFYVCIYTMWLKRRTPQNIVIGGAAGAFPPMIGWAAVTGGIDLTAVALFGIIFLWTPPHFWALALVRSSDYEAADVPMLPVVSGDRSTRRQIMAYTLLLVPVSLAPCATGACRCGLRHRRAGGGRPACSRCLPRPRGSQPGRGEAALRRLDRLSLRALRAAARGPRVAGSGRAMRMAS